jgi:hypothetical protein
MSTNQKLTNDPTTSTSSAGNQAGEKKAKRGALDLSAAQIVGGALAAMTAAALGSQLSVAGTVVGAALASIIAAVAGSLYTTSLRRTGDKVKTVFRTGQPNEVEEPTVIEIIPDNQGHIAGQRSRLLAPVPTGSPSPGRRGPKLNWKRIAVAALAAFGIAAASLTAVELATGHALSGGGGTTIQQVSEGRSNNGSDTKKKEPSAKPTHKATTAATEEPTAEPSARARTSEPEATTSAPTPEATTTTQATAAPRATSDGTP